MSAPTSEGRSGVRTGESVGPQPEGWSAPARGDVDPRVLAYLEGGPGDGATVQANVKAWESIPIRPRVLRDVTEVDTAVSLFGVSSPVPVLAAPWAGHGLVDPDGEIATAKGLAAAGIPMVQSSGSSVAVTDVARYSGPFWQQLYVPDDRSLVEGFLDRAVAAGATAFVLTVDHPAVGNTLPFRSGLFHVADRRPPANFTEVPPGSALGTATDLGPADIAWLTERTGLPVIVKGVLRGDDADAAVAAGAAAVIVSNHGGRQLAGSITTAAALPEVVMAVRGRVPVLVDGGIRRGEDVLRALALGATATLVGRPVVRALVEGGEQGVARWARDFGDDVRRVLVLAGAPTLPQVAEDLVRAAAEPPGATRGGRAAVVAALRAELQPTDVLVEPGEIEPYLTDVTGELPPEPPAAVVIPRSVAQVQAVARIATRLRVPLVTRGRGTGLSGGAVAEPGGIVLSTHALATIEIDAADQVAVVGPGAITADVDAAARAHGLMYAPDPASSHLSSIGGNIATNAGGLRCVKYGVTRDAVLGLQVVLADGRALRTGHRTVKGVTGLDLTGLFVGSEGTLGIVVSATLRLLPAPVHERTLVVSSDNLAQAARAVELVTGSGVRPSCVELLDRATLENIDANRGTDLAERHGQALLLVRTDGFGADAEIAHLHASLQAAGLAVELLEDSEGERYAELRRSGRGRLTGRWVVGEDVAVPRGKLVAMLTALTEIGTRHGIDVAAVAHAGDGNLHPALSTPRADGQDGPPAHLVSAADELVRTALALGGTISGEHGVGRAKRAWLADELGEDQIALQRAIKAVLDPDGLLNPHGFLAAGAVSYSSLFEEAPA